MGKTSINIIEKNPSLRKSQKKPKNKRYFEQELDSSLVQNTDKRKENEIEDNIFIDTNNENSSIEHQKGKIKYHKSFLRKTDNEILHDKDKFLTQQLFGLSRDSDGESENEETPDENLEDEDHESMSEESELEVESESRGKKRKVAWVDEDDEDIKVKDVVAGYARARGSRGVRETSSVKYEKILKEKFDEVYGSNPEWAQIGRVVDKESDDDDEQDIDMSAKAGIYLSQVKGVGKLPKDRIIYKFFKPLNDESLGEGKVISSIDFNRELNIALVGGCSTSRIGAVTLFKFDGKENHKIKSLFFENFPVKFAKFLPGRNQFIAGSIRKKYFYLYDIKQGKKFRMPCHTDERIMKKFDVTPDGKYMVGVADGGNIHFLDSNSLTFIEMLRIPCEVRDFTFSNDSSLLYAYGSNGKVYICDLINWRCRHCFYDDGCIAGNSIAASPNGKYLACGSSSGIINIYDASKLSDETNPTPLKSVKNFYTAVTSLEFNHTSEILAAASSVKNNSTKLIHMASLNVFANFPGNTDKFSKVQTVKFSPDSKYLVVATNKKKAFLLRLFHY